MDWLARQPFSRVALAAAAWSLLLPAAAYAAFRLFIWYATRRGDLVAYAVVQVRWPAIVGVLLVPPTALLLAWWAARRARQAQAGNAAPST